MSNTQTQTIGKTMRELSSLTIESHISYLQSLEHDIVLAKLALEQAKKETEAGHVSTEIKEKVHTRTKTVLATAAKIRRHVRDDRNLEAGA